MLLKSILANEVAAQADTAVKKNRRTSGQEINCSECVVFIPPKSWFLSIYYSTPVLGWLCVDVRQEFTEGLRKGVF